MKIAAGKVEAFVKSPDKMVKAALIYGPDIGLVATRAEVLAKTIVPNIHDPFNVAELSAEAIEESPAALLDEMCSLSLMGGRRLIKVRDAGTTAAFAKAVEAALAAPTGDSFLLLTAGDLTPKSALRNLAETHAAMAALPCYHDDVAGISSVILAELRARGFAADRDAVRLMSESCLGDRMVALSEVEKLSLYMGQEKNITRDHVELSIGDTTESSAQDLANAVADGNHILIEKHLRKMLLQQNAAAIGAMRMVTMYFLKLYEIAAILEKGMEPNEAVESLRPPVFFKQKPTLERHVRVWSRDVKKLTRALAILREAEALSKRTGANAELLASRHLMMVANIAKTSSKAA